MDEDSSTEGNRGFMPWDLWKKIVDECSQYEDVILTPSWKGEPMLHPQFQEFMDYAISRLDERIRLTTDGTLISEKNKETLRNLTWITVNVNNDKGFENAVWLNKERYTVNDQYPYLTLAFTSDSEATKKYFNYIVGDPSQDFRGFDFVVYHYNLKEDSSYHDPYVGKTILIDPEGSVAFYLHPYHDNLETMTLADIWHQHDLDDSPDQVYHDCATRNRYGSQFYTPCNDYSKSTNCPKCDGILSQNAIFCLDCEKQDVRNKLISQIQEIPNSKILSGYKVFRISSTDFEVYKVEDLEEDDEGPYSDSDWNGTAHEIADYIQGVLTSDLDREEYSCSRCEALIKRNEELCMGCYEREGLEEMIADIAKITDRGTVSGAMVKRIGLTEFEIYNDQNVCKCSGNMQKVAEYVYFFYPY